MFRSCLIATPDMHPLQLPHFRVPPSVDVTTAGTSAPPAAFGAQSHLESSAVSFFLSVSTRIGIQPDVQVNPSTRTLAQLSSCDTTRPPERRMLQHVLLLLLLLLAGACSTAAYSYDPSIGTNCIKYGGGSQPVKIACKGCVAERGLQCIWDMRSNVSGNVHPECPINSVRYKPVSACCPVAQGKSIKRGTSAYPDALACLSGHKCSQFYNELLEECIEQCGDRNLCTGGQESSARSSRAFPSMSIVMVLSAAVGLLLSV